MSNNNHFTTISTFVGDEKDTNPVTKTVASLAELAQLSTETNWGPFTFDGKRDLDHFQGSDLLVFDVDEGLTINLAREKLESAGLAYAITTTRNHQKQKKEKGACDRFRVIQILEYKVLDYENYKATRERYGQLLGLPFDPASTDLFFFKGLEIYSVNEKGGTAKPSVRSATLVSNPAEDAKKEKGQLSVRTRIFLKDSAPDGEFNDRLFRAAKDHQEQGFSEGEQIQILQKVTGTLDRTDIATIRSANRRAPRYQPRQIQRRMKTATRAIVRDYLAQTHTLYSHHDKSINMRMEAFNSKMNFGEFMNVLLLDLDAAGMDLDKDLIQRAVEEWVKEEGRRVVDSVRASIKHDPNTSNGELNKFVIALMGTHSDLTSAVLKHFIWQVKRKLSDLDVDNHMMPVIVGSQGAGKSVALKKFISPLEDLSDSPPSIPTLTDERQYAYLGNYFILYFDEMSGAARADIDALKGIITKKELTQRIMRSTNHNHIVNRSTLIGTANQGVSDLIQDTTGVRRFWEIKCAEKLDWQIINSIDYIAVWKAVDEKQESPIVPFLDEIRKIQNNELRNKDSIESWVDELEFERLGDNTAEKDWDAFSAIYQSYTCFCNEAHLIPFSKPKFGKKLKNLGFLANSNNKERRYNIHIMNKRSSL